MKNKMTKIQKNERKKKKEKTHMKRWLTEKAQVYEKMIIPLKLEQCKLQLHGKIFFT